MPDIHIHCTVFISIGALCAVPAANEAGAGFLAQADQALYEAKAQGRNRAVVRSGV